MGRSRVLRLAWWAAPMCTNVFQPPFSGPGIRTHMHRLGSGHMSSNKPVCEGDIEITGSLGVYSLALYRPR
jgi:hypothetical protein